MNFETKETICANKVNGRIYMYLQVSPGKFPIHWCKPEKHSSGSF